MAFYKYCISVCYFFELSVTYNVGTMSKDYTTNNLYMYQGVVQNNRTLVEDNNI